MKGQSRVGSFSLKSVEWSQLEMGLHVSMDWTRFKMGKEVEQKKNNEQEFVG